MTKLTKKNNGIVLVEPVSRFKKVIETEKGYEMKEFNHTDGFLLGGPNAEKDLAENIFITSDPVSNNVTVHMVVKDALKGEPTFKMLNQKDIHTNNTISDAVKAFAGLDWKPDSMGVKNLVAAIEKREHQGGKYVVVKDPNSTVWIKKDPRTKVCQINHFFRDLFPWDINEDLTKLVHKDVEKVHLDFLLGLAGGSTQSREVLLYLLSKNIHNPCRPVKHAVLLASKVAETGKSMFMTLHNSVMGPTMSVHEETYADTTFDEELFVHGSTTYDEVCDLGGETSTRYQKFKAKVTSPTVSRMIKHCDGVKMQNAGIHIMGSNNPPNLPADQRRLVYFQVVHDTQSAAQYVRDMKDLGVLEDDDDIIEVTPGGRRCLIGIYQKYFKKLHPYYSRVKGFDLAKLGSDPELWERHVENGLLNQSKEEAQAKRSERSALSGAQMLSDIWEDTPDGLIASFEMKSKGKVTTLNTYTFVKAMNFLEVNEMTPVKNALNKLIVSEHFEPLFDKTVPDTTSNRVVATFRPGIDKVKVFKECMNAWVKSNKDVK